jgi:hypothetical protein
MAIKSKARKRSGKSALGLKNPYPKGLRLKMLKNSEKFSLIASAILSPEGSVLGV